MCRALHEQWRLASDQGLVRHLLRRFEEKTGLCTFAAMRRRSTGSVKISPVSFKQVEDSRDKLLDALERESTKKRERLASNFGPRHAVPDPHQESTGSILPVESQLPSYIYTATKTPEISRDF
jgi:hypothetical protein